MGKINLERVWGSAPWLKTKEVVHYRAKVFKSGNSLALRLPAGLGLEAGTEMDLRVENGQFFSFEPTDAPKRKFNIDKVWGSATGLELIKPEDRVFEERPLLWDDPDLPSPDDAK
jgi:antitoxin VapB